MSKVSNGFTVVLSSFMLLFLFSCKKTSSNYHPLSWGKSMGNPEKELRVFNKEVEKFYKKKKAWPSFLQIKQLVQHDDIPNCLFYSYNASSYQIAIWTGETAWAYDSKTNSYYEFDTDIRNYYWYDVKNALFLSKEEAVSQYKIEYSYHYDKEFLSGSKSD